MTLHGAIFICICLLLVSVWVLNLVRKGRLYVGYGIIFLAASVGIAITVAVPSILTLVTTIVGAVFPASALTLLALGFIGVMLIYILGQLTVISNRLAALIQEIAIRDAQGRNRGTTDGHHE